MANKELATKPANVLLAGQSCSEEELDFLLEENLECSGDLELLGLNAFCFELM